MAYRDPVKVRGNISRLRRRLGGATHEALGVVTHRRRTDPSLFTAAELGLDPELEAELKTFRGCCE